MQKTSGFLFPPTPCDHCSFQKSCCENHTLRKETASPFQSAKDHQCNPQHPSRTTNKQQKATKTHHNCVNQTPQTPSKAYPPPKNHLNQGEDPSDSIQNPSKIHQKPPQLRPFEPHLKLICVMKLIWLWVKNTGYLNKTSVFFLTPSHLCKRPCVLNFDFEVALATQQLLSSRREMQLPESMSSAGTKRKAFGDRV